MKTLKLIWYLFDSASTLKTLKGIYKCTNATITTSQVNLLKLRLVLDT